MKRILYFLYKLFRSDKIQTLNERIYSRKQIIKIFEEFKNSPKHINYGELNHPSIENYEGSTTHTYK